MTNNYLARAEIWMLITTLLYFLMNGAQIFETLVFAPRWAASPPSTLQFLVDGHGASMKSFWIIFHSLHEITFILAIIFCWKIEPIRNWLIVLFVLHMAIRVWTIIYFAPNIIEFQKLAQVPELVQDLTKRIAQWQFWNYIRVGIYMLISLGMIPLCLKVFHLKG